MLKDFFDRRRSKKIARMILENAAEHGDITRAVCERTDRMIEVAFISISAPDGSTYSERSDLVSDLAGQHGGMVDSVVPIMIVTFGAFGTVPPGACLNFVRNVQSALPGLTAIVHGSITASVGAFAGAERQDFGFWWPHTLEALRQLAALVPGKSIELPSPPKS
jgi:hypothetical protein